MLALVDCNNFYASCERVFRPELEHKPIIVLSNNDGCVIARSNEAKELGIRMGIPYFQIKHICDKYNIKTFSSNYTLYADMSQRFMSILKQLSIQQEIYSIDESFIDLTGISNLTLHGQKICSTIKQWVGLPVCIGIGETKVLAKFANFLAKRYSFLNRVCNLEELGEDRVNKAMQITPVNELWGIGRKLAPKLQGIGINTVYDLKKSDPKLIRKIFSITVEKIVQELNGIQCIDLDLSPDHSKCLISSRSFGKNVTDKDALLASLAYHANKLSVKLRKQQLFAKNLIIFVNSNRFGDNYFKNSVNISLAHAINSPRDIIKLLDDALNDIYKPNINYKKSGIIVTEFISKSEEINDLFGSTNIQDDSLLPTLELIKKRFKKDVIHNATIKLSDQWLMNRDFMSPRYTSNVDEILCIKI